jgi:uncharacterized repeat protein (TIGR01451 family)
MIERKAPFRVGVLGAALAIVAAVTSTPASATSAITRSADLWVESVYPSPFELHTMIEGETVTYTITVKNNGPNQAQNVAVTDTATPGMTTVQNVTAPTGWSCNTGLGVEQVASCSKTSLLRGASAIIVVRIHFPPLIHNQFTTDTATISSSTPDPNPANNAATVIVKVI